MLFSFASEKGGCGKSYAAISFAQYVRYRLNKPVTIIECNREIPDVGRRFIGDPNFRVENVDVRAGDWSRFTDVADADPSAVVIANWPGNVEATFPDERAAAIAGLRTLGVPIVLAWLMNCNEDGILALRREVNLCSYVPAEELLLVPNLVHGRIEDFAWTTSLTRDEYLAAGAVEVELPKQYGPMARHWVDPRISFLAMREGHAAIDGMQLSAGPRLSLHHWLVRVTDPLWDYVAEQFGLRTANASAAAR